MPVDLSETLVIGISATALFDLSEADNIFREKVEHDSGTAMEKYREYMLQNESEPLNDDTGMPLVDALLRLNKHQKDGEPPIVDVVVMSRNSPETGYRVISEIRRRKLKITRFAFTEGESNIEYLDGFYHAESLLDSQKKIYTISNKTLDILIAINWFSQMFIQKKRFNYLENIFGEYSLNLNPVFHSYYILKIKNRNYLKKELMKYNIYLPVHWSKFEHDNILYDVYYPICDYSTDIVFYEDVAAASYFANIQTDDAKAFANSYAAKFGSDAAILNALSTSCYDGLTALDAIAERAGGLSVKEMDSVAEGTAFGSPRGDAVMKNRHLTLDIYLAEAIGTDFKIIKTFSRFFLI